METNTKQILPSKSMVSLSLKCNQGVLEHVIRFLDELLPCLKGDRISEWIRLSVKDSIQSNQSILGYYGLLMELINLRILAMYEAKSVN